MTQIAGKPDLALRAISAVLATRDAWAGYGEQAPISLPTPGDVVVRCDLCSHKEKAVRRAIRKADERTVDATWSASTIH